MNQIPREWPEFAPEFAASDELPLDDDHQIELWNMKLIDRLETTSKNLGWSFQTKAVSLSASAKFPFIFRAKVVWTTDESTQFTQVYALWENHLGQRGVTGGEPRPL